MNINETIFEAAQWVLILMLAWQLHRQAPLNLGIVKPIGSLVDKVLDKENKE